MSEPITGEEVAVAERCTLHIRKTGMKSVRARERVSNRRADHMMSRGNEQMYRPRKSPMLKTRK